MNHESENQSVNPSSSPSRADQLIEALEKFAEWVDFLIVEIVDDSKPLSVRKAFSLGSTLLMALLLSGFIAQDRLKEALFANFFLVVIWGVATALVTGNSARVSTNIRLMAIWCCVTILLLAAFRFACDDFPTPVVLCTGISLLFLVPMHVSRSHLPKERKVLITFALWSSNAILTYFVYWR